jgi:hypothetical protein
MAVGLSALRTYTGCILTKLLLITYVVNIGQYTDTFHIELKFKYVHIELYCCCKNVLVSAAYRSSSWIMYKDTSFGALLPVSM